MFFCAFFIQLEKKLDPRLYELMVIDLLHPRNTIQPIGINLCLSVEPKMTQNGAMR